MERVLLLGMEGCRRLRLRQATADGQAPQGRDTHNHDQAHYRSGEIGLAP